jgi:hypothetical protein
MLSRFNSRRFLEKFSKDRLNEFFNDVNKNRDSLVKHYNLISVSMGFDKNLLRKKIRQYYGYDWDEEYDMFCSNVDIIANISDEYDEIRKKELIYLLKFMTGSKFKNIRQEENFENVVSGNLDVIPNLSDMFKQLTSRLTLNERNQGFFFLKRVDIDGNIAICMCKPSDQFDFEENYDTDLEDRVFMDLITITDELTIEALDARRLRISDHSKTEMEYWLPPIKYIQINEEWIYDVDEDLLFNDLRELSENEKMDILKKNSSPTTQFVEFLTLLHFNRKYMYALISLKQDAETFDWDKEVVDLLMEAIKRSIIR